MIRLVVLSRVIWLACLSRLSHSRPWQAVSLGERGFLVDDFPNPCCTTASIPSLLSYSTRKSFLYTFFRLQQRILTYPSGRCSTPATVLGCLQQHSAGFLRPTPVMLLYLLSACCFRGQHGERPVLLHGIWDSPVTSLLSPADILPARFHAATDIRPCNPMPFSLMSRVALVFFELSVAGRGNLGSLPSQERRVILA